jgi:glycosyltransferase involved in cell wall biosynthesis
MSSRGLRIGFVEPHLRRFGGIRRVVEFGNRLVARGHDVVFLLPDDEPLVCSWMQCDVPIAPLSQGVSEPWDVVVFNHEPQWHVIPTFERARRTVFYALHYGRLYGKEGSWEALRAPVDAMFANSGWTADLIEAEVGVRPTVVLGGVNREVFSPWGGPKRYPVLCSGIDKWWKGTDTIEAACGKLGLPLEGYSGKDLDQPALGREYDAAQVFAVGSLFEGFCQPGLEALACGVPLVTTDNGGCREYAIDGETALVVAPEPGGCRRTGSTSWPSTSTGSAAPTSSSSCSTASWRGRCRGHPHRVPRRPRRRRCRSWCWPGTTCC